jgi:uncharacterized peroxidase-related enzyme
MANRLAILKKQSMRDKFKYTSFEQVFGFSPDVMDIISTRTELDISVCSEVISVWRKPGPAWSQGEIELFSSFVSSQNNCIFWMFSHGAVASRYLGEDVVNEAFEDWTKARVRPKVKAVLGMLAKLTRQPLEFGAADMKGLLDAGISPGAIEQAVIGAAFVFNYQNRMADALGADIPRDKLQRAGVMLNLMGQEELENNTNEGEMPSLDGVMPAEVMAFYKSVCQGEGDSEVRLRKAIVDWGLWSLGLEGDDAAIPDTLVDYVDTVIRHAPDVTEEDIEDLLSEGWSEAEIFEITVAAAFSAGYGRLKIAWAALSEARGI